MRKCGVNYSDLVCLNCGSIFTISRFANRCREVGHIKDIWCPRCKEVTKHYEVHDADVFACGNYNNELKVKVKTLIKNNREV